MLRLSMGLSSTVLAVAAVLVLLSLRMVHLTWTPSLSHGLAVFGQLWRHSDLWGLLAIVVVALGEHLPSRWSLKGVATAAASCILLISFWVFLHAANSYVAGVVFAGSAIFLIDCWARVHVPHAVLACVLQGLFYRFFSTTLPQTSTSGAVASGPWLKMALALLAASGASIFVLLFAHDAADTEATPNSGPGAERSSKKKKTWLKRTDKEHWKLQDASYSVPYTGFAPAIGSGHFTSKDVDRVMSTFGHASMALLLFLSGGSSAPIQTVHVFSNNVRFRSVSVALLLYSCAAAVVYHVVAVVFLLCNAGLQFVLWLLGPLWRLLRSVLVFFEPGAKANVWCAYVRKNGSCEETVLDCGDTKAHRTAHIKVLVNDVWIQLRLLSVVHVKDVLKGLEKHFGIPSVFCTLKYQGRTLTRKECIPTDPATPLELCFKSPQGLDSTKPLQKLQSNATAQIQQMVDGLAGIESKHSEADRGLADTDKLILLGRVDERLLRELRKLEHQSTAHKTGVAMESTSLIEILMDEGWRNEHCTMQVFVEVGGRRHGTITLNVRPSDDVTMLQRRICDTVGVPLEQQRLTYGTKELQAGQTLADYGIEKESTIRLGGRLLGGGNCCRKCVGGGIVQVAAGPDEAGAGPSPASAPAQTSSEGNVARRDQEPASKEERVEAVVQVAAGADEAGAGPSPASAPAQTSSEGNVARRIQEPASKKEREPVLVEAIVQGQWDAQLVKALQAHKVPKIIRVFLSSTFTDTAEERNHILKVVVPKLQELFGRHGYEFQASEMRWSIREGESNDMQTSAICMIELSNCQASAGLTYVYIECDKYGFRPPPKTIPQDVFRMLVVEMPDDDRVFIEECYKLDTNSVHTPPEFKTHMPTCGPTGQVREAWDSQDGPQFVLQIGTSDPVKPKDKAAQAVAWARFMSLCTTLRAAAWKVWHQENPRDKKSHHFLKKFIISVTEEELCHGALWANPEPGRTRIKIFKRSFKEQEGTFKGIPLHDPTAKAFVDMDNMQVDKEAQKLLDEQKAMVEPDHAWSILWAEGKGVDPTKEEHKQYLDEFCARFEEACIDSLNEALANEIESDSVVDEPERHLRFAAERAGKYHPTPTAVTVVDNVMTFLGNGRDGKVFVVHGKSGAGKTYIMSEVTRRAAVKAKDIGGVCVARFLGTTAASSKVSLLLEAIILQIARAYGKGTDLEIPSDFRKLQALFVEAVKTWPSEAKPMTLILDSVDQLDDTNGGRRLQWLPASDLPSCVRIIVSSLPDYPTIDEKQGFKCLSLLQGALKDEGCFSKVADIEDPREVVEHLLRLQGRALTEQQMQAVLGAFERRSANDMAGTPLWLTLVAHKAAKWHSYTLPPVIPSSVRELIVELFQDLAKQRGAKLVRKVLACLTLCKDGISEVELAHVLSLDDEVLAEAYEWWAPPVRVIPCICITRILADLEPFLANRGNGGAKGWYHRQFWEAAEAWLFKSEGSELREGVHAELADYFSGKHHGVPKRYSQELQVVVQKHFPGETAGDRLVPAQATMLSGDVLDADSTGQMRLNERRLTEYVHHSARAGWQTETLAELASPLYMTLKFMAAMGTDLQLELVDAMQRFPQAAQALQRVKAFVGKNIEICRRPEVPSAILQAAHNEPDASPVRKSLLAVKDFAKHSIQWINRSQLFDPCQLLLSATSEVMAVAYASDGKRVAYGCSDGTIQVVSALTGDILSSLRGHTGTVTSVAFSPDGSSLASGSVDQTVRVWDPSTGEEKRSLRGHTGWVKSVVFSPDGKSLASGSDDATVRVWDPSTGEEKRSLRGHTGRVYSVAFSPNGQMLASGSDDNTVRVWDPSTGEEKRSLTGHTDYVRSVAFSPNGQMLASGSDDKTVRVWDPSTGEEKRSLTGHTGRVFSVAFSPNGQMLASGSDDKTVRVWDPSTGEEKRSLTGHTGEVTSVAFSPNGQMLASGSEDKTVRVWDPSTGEEKRSLTGHTNWVSSVVFSPDGKSLASGSDDATVRVWDPSTGEEKRSLTGHTEAVTSVAFSPNGQMLASGSTDKTVRVWDPLTGEEKRSLTGHTGWVLSVAFSPNGQMLASGSDDKTVRVWDPSTGEEKRSLTGHTGRVFSVAFSPNGQMLASGSYDKTVRVWDPSTGEEKRSLTGHTGDVNSVAFSPNCQMLASGSDDKTVRVWDPSTGEEKRSLTGHTGRVFSVAFSPNGQMLASGSNDKTVRVWDPSTGEEKRSLRGRMFCWCPGHIATAEGTACRVYRMDGRLVSYVIAPSTVNSVTCSGKLVTAGCVSGEVMHLQVDFLVD